MVFSPFKHYIPYYLPLKDYLLKVTNGNQEELLMLLPAFDHPKKVKHREMHPKLKIFYCPKLGGGS